MTAQQLKASILDLAIRGKLVPQDPNDEPAEKLLERIAAERSAAPRGRAGRATLPAVSEEEKPFDLPKGWAWCHLCDLTVKIGAGATPLGGRSVYVKAGVKFLREQNIHDEGLSLDNVVYITTEIHNSRLGSKVEAKDILLNEVIAKPRR